MKKLLFTLAAAATFAAMAGDPNKRDPGDIDLIGFDNFDFTQNVSSNVVGHNDYGTGSFNESQWVSTTGDDDSVVKPHPSGIESVLTNVPAPFVANENVNYLALDTNGSELQRYFSTDTTNGTATAVAATGTYIDTLVQFTVTEDEEPTIDGTTKLAIWMGVGDGATNLYVKGGYYDESGAVLSVTPQTYKLDKSCVPGTWYRLTVKAYSTIGNADATKDGTILPAFTILIDGKEVASTAAVYSSAALALICPSEGEGGGADYLAADKLALLKAGKIIPSLDATFAPGTLFCVGFQGTGAIDDLVVTDLDPSPTPSVIDFTLAWTASEVSAVSYVLSTDLATTNQLTNGTAVQLAPGDGTATIELIPTFTTGYEFDKVTMGETELGLTFAIPDVTTNATLVAKAATPAYPTYIDITDTTIKGKYDAWKNTYQADTQSAWETAFLLNMDPTESVAAGTALLKIASITEVSGGWELEIVSDATTLTAETNNDGLVGNGYLAITYAADLATLTSGGTTVNLPVTVTDGKIKVTVSAPGAKFMKATLTSTPASQE